MRTRIIGKGPLWTALGLMAICEFATGCSTRQIIPVPYSEQDRKYQAHAVLSIPVDEIYSRALQVAEQVRAENVKIVSTDPTRHRIEVTNGTQTAVFLAERLDAKNTWITIMADGRIIQEVNGKEEKAKEAEEDFALEIIANLCKAINIECAILKKWKWQ
jgi:hypothetical protein